MAFSRVVGCRAFRVAPLLCRSFSTVCPYDRFRQIWGDNLPLEAGKFDTSRALPWIAKLIDKKGWSEEVAKTHSFYPNILKGKQPEPLQPYDKGALSIKLQDTPNRQLLLLGRDYFYRSVTDKEVNNLRPLFIFMNRVRGFDTLFPSDPESTVNCAQYAFGEEVGKNGRILLDTFPFLRSLGWEQIPLSGVRAGHRCVYSSAKGAQHFGKLVWGEGGKLHVISKFGPQWDVVEHEKELVPFKYGDCFTVWKK